MNDNFLTFFFFFYFFRNTERYKLFLLLFDFFYGETINDIVMSSAEKIITRYFENISILCVYLK